MPNGLRIEHLCDISPKAQSWLVLNLPVFNVPPTRITEIWLEMYQIKRLTDMEQSTLSMFCFYQLGLCSVSYTANEYSIYHFCIIIKDFFISFSRVIIVQDLETVIFFSVHADLLCYFLFN